MASKAKNKMSRFEIRTPSAVCAVRGTDFAIEASSASADIGLFEGRLEIESGGKTTLLPAGSEFVSESGSESKVQARFSRLMEEEKRRYLRLKKRAEELRARLEDREGYIDSFVRDQQNKLQDFEERRKKALKK